MRVRIPTICLGLALAVLGATGSPEAIAADDTDGLYAAPKAGGARRWQITAPDGVALLAAPRGDPLPMAPLSDQAVVSNLGCALDQDQVWCDVRSLRGGPRGFVTAAALAPVAGPDGIVARGPNDSAKRAKRKRFDQTGEVPCAQEQGQALAPCPIGVARSDGGDVTASVTFPSGFVRHLFFMHGAFISASATMSGVGRDIDWAVVDGVHRIRVDDQRFDIPESLLFGGR